MADSTSGGTTTSLNNTPQAKDDYYTANEDQVLYLYVMENDLGGNAKVLWSVDNTSDDGSGDLVAKDVAGVCEYSELGAKISLTSDGRIKYDTTLLDGLAAGQTVTDQFTYAIRLSNGTLSWATVTVTLTGTNDGPVAVNDVASGSEDTVITGSVATNDSDVDAGAVLCFAVNGTAPAGFAMDQCGNWTLDASDPAYQRIALGATQDVVVSYTVTDEHGASATATLTVTVGGTNDAPEASDDAAGVAEDADISESVAGNDGDVDDGAELTYALVEAAPEGLSFDTDGSWSFDASSYDSLPEGEELVLTIPYTVTDQHGATDSATLTITITGTNDAPVAVADLATTGENDLLTIDVLANDTDADNGADLTVTAASAPSGQGSVSVVDNKVSFDPGSDFDHLAAGASANVTVSYTIVDEHGASSSSTVQIAVTGTNDGPVASVDEGTTGENAVLLVDVLANDTDVDDGAVLTVTAASAPSGQGSASVVDNKVQFDPGTDFDHLNVGDSEVVTVNYTIVDEHGASANSTIEFTVTGINDAPVATADLATVDEDNGITGSVATNDKDADDGALLTYTLDDPTDVPAGLIFGSDGSWSFDASSYDSLPEGSQLILTIPYTVTDEHGASDGATLTITVTGTNDGPVASEDSATTGENNVLTADVLANDTDADDGAVLTVTAASAPSGQGTASVVSNQVQFDPGADFDHLNVGDSEIVTVSYSIVDEHGASSSSTIEITVTGTNDGPVANADSDTTSENAAITIDVLANDTDVDDGAVLTVTAANAPLDQGTASVVGNQVEFDPGTDFDYLADGESTQVVVNYSIEDEHGASSNSTLTITVTGTNDAPVAVADEASTDEDNSVLIDVLANDSDADASDTLTISAAIVTTGLGSVTIESGQLRYDPGSDYNHLAVGESAEVTLSYTIDDGNGGTDTASVTVTVTGVNDAPVAVGVTDATDEDTVFNGAVIGSDVDGDALTYALATGESLPDGVTFNSDGTFSVAPLASDQALDDGESRVVTFDVVANDGAVDSAPQAVTITINGANDAPELTGAAASLPAGSEDNSYTVTQEQLLQGWTDVDVEALTATGLAASNGSVFQNADGSYTITPAVNYNGPVTLSYFVSDGTTSVAASLGYTLAPVNDAATIIGSAAGMVVEDAVPNTVGGNLDSTDVDGVDDSWNAVLVAAASTNGYGTYTIDESGNWVYSLDNGSAAVDDLNDGETLSDSFTVTTADGTSQVVTITINGHTDFTYVSPAPFTGTGDPNDNDALGNPAGQNTSSQATNGNDTLYGGAGDDTINGGNGNDTIYGGSGGDGLGGGGDLDRLFGGSGTDTIVGGVGNDTIVGGYGADILTGSNGADTFFYLSQKDTGDTILDFSKVQGDKIKFDTSFDFDASDFMAAIESAGAVDAGKFGYMYDASTNTTTIYVDTDDAFGADMEIKLSGNVTLTSGDFLFGGI